MPGGIPPLDSASKLNEQPGQNIPPPPYSLSGAGAAAIAANNSKTWSRYEDTRTTSRSHSNSVLPISVAPNNAILKPKPGYDVVALIFLLLKLPQSVSCVVLTSYILSGTFKSFAGKFITRCILHFDNGIEYNLEAYSKKRYSYYRSELLGEFLQLFSINSFILLICHYSLPRAWFHYLIVLAKSIIASRLVGTYTTGSTTYVSVVSNNANNASCITTTSTTNNTQHAHLTGNSKPDASNYTPSSFANFITGFSCVVAANYIKERMAASNMQMIFGDLSKLCATFLSSKADNLDHYVERISENSAYSPSFSTSIDYMSSKKSTYYEDTKLFSAKATWASKVLFQILVKCFRLGEKSTERLSYISRELCIVVNFAYLVLCIHVISLTISPFLKRIFILKDYSKTLDHLSCLTPDVPFGGFKKGALATALPREPASDSVVVINMDQPRVQSATISGPHEIKVIPEIAETPVGLPLCDTKASIAAENFKIFCLKPPATKISNTTSRHGHNRTIVDRKRSNSTSTPSTTIMDKFFTISSQPIWTWLAAIKILIASPFHFNGPSWPPSSHENGLISQRNLDLALVSVEDSKIVFQVMNSPRLDALMSDLSLRVNGLPWMFVDVYSSNASQTEIDNIYVTVYALSASHQFQIDFFLEESLAAQNVVRTSCRKDSRPIDPQNFSSVGILQSCLSHSISSLSDMKANFKKSKKEESKRVSELKRSVDTLKTRIDKHGVTQSNEGRISGKLKGLQEWITQLENEIKDLESQIFDFEHNSETFEKEYQIEESKLTSEILELESYIREHEQNTNKLRMDFKNVEGEKQATDSRLRKLETKLRSKKEEVAKLTSEIKGFKKTMSSKIQRRQRKTHDRIESIIPTILEASDDLNDELVSYSEESNQVT